MWLSNQTENVTKDLRFTFRSCRKTPASVAVIVLTLMFGIGINVAVFTIFNAFVLRGAPVRDPARLTTLGIVEKDTQTARRLRYEEYQSLCANPTVFRALAAYTSTAVVTPFGMINGRLVSSNYFDVLGGRMIVGRPFSENENRKPAAEPVLVVSYNAWRRRFHGDPDVVGKTTRLAGSSFTIIGVAEQHFGGLERDLPEFWAPIMMNSVLGPGPLGGVVVVGRLPQNLSVEEAQSTLSPLVRALLVGKPVVGVTLTPQQSLGQVDGSTIRVFAPFVAAFGMVLLIACCNVANLLLARGAARRGELVVRLSLGASRARLLQQLLTEGSVLALAGGFLALPFSQLVTRLFYIAATALFPPWVSFDFVEAHVDARVFLYTMALSLATTLIFGLAPALQSTRGDLTLELKEGTRRRMGRRTIGDRLVAAQMALCLILLIVGGMLLNAVVRLSAFSPGYDTNEVFSIHIIRRVFYNAEQTAALAQFRWLFAERLRTIPGVGAVSLAELSPLLGMPQVPVATEDRPTLRATGYSHVGSQYFQVLGIPVVRGRSFSPSEIAGEAPVAIVTQGAASSFWPGKNPIGRRLVFTAEPSAAKSNALSRVPQYSSVEVIGVVRDVASVVTSDRSDLCCVYLPARANDTNTSSLLVRIDGDPRHVIEAIRSEFAAMDRDSILDINSLSAAVKSLLRWQQLGSKIAGSLGLLGLLLASVGLYGVMSYTVTCRVPEIGVRIALGARRWNVLWLILAQASRLAIHGILVGIFAATVACRVLASVFYKQPAFDLATFTVVPAFLLFVCLLAAFVPAWRATRVDPMTALRCE